MVCFEPVVSPCLNPTILLRFMSFLITAVPHQVNSHTETGGRSTTTTKYSIIFRYGEPSMVSYGPTLPVQSSELKVNPCCSNQTHQTLRNRDWVDWRKRFLLSICLPSLPSIKCSGDIFFSQGHVMLFPLGPPLVILV